MYAVIVPVEFKHASSPSIKNIISLYIHGPKLAQASKFDIMHYWMQYFDLTLV